MLNNEHLLKSILDGVHGANNLYLKMTGDASIRDYGIEPYVSSKIAQRIFNKGKNLGKKIYVTLETPFSTIIEYSNSSIRFKGADARRADVVCWQTSERPFGVIELKRHFVFSQSEKDIDRTTVLMNKLGEHNNGSLQFGAVAGFRERWDTTKKNAESVLVEYLASCRKRFKNYEFEGRHREKDARALGVSVAGETLHAFQAYAVVFRRKK